MRKRIIPCIFLKNGLIIRSEKFETHQIIGNAVTEVQRYNEWAVDEIIYIDISRDTKYDLRRNDMKFKNKINSKVDLIKYVSEVCFVPLAFGGGIRSLTDIQELLSNGADKVILNTVLFLENDFLDGAVKLFGSQALVACVDYKEDGFVYYQHGSVKSNYKVLEWCELLAEQGIGEILLNNIDRDGMACGYDIDTISTVVEALDLPVIALSGAGDYFDFVECFQEANPAAVAAGNLFHFKEHSYWHAKNISSSNNVNVRVPAEE